MHTLITVHDDGSADLTVADGDYSHQFSAVAEGDCAAVSFEESQSHRGMLHTLPPREEVWKEVMQSDEMTKFMDDNGLTATTREAM